MGNVVYSGSARPVSKEFDDPDEPAVLEPLRILPVVPGGLYLSWMSPRTTSEQRSKILTATMGDIFRVGAHFALYNALALERKTVEVRHLAVSMGFANVYPEAYCGSEQIRDEVLRLRGLMKETVEALPIEIRNMESKGRVRDLMDLIGRCPTFNDGNMLTLLGLFVSLILPRTSFVVSKTDTSMFLADMALRIPGELS